MKVLFVSSEVAPYSKTGGLADVAGALPVRLLRSGNEVRTLTPLYRTVDRSRLRPCEAIGTRRLLLGDVEIEWSLRHDDNVYFIDAPALFDRPYVYGNGPDEALRFAGLCHIALASCTASGWEPDLIHCNDWQTALIPVLLRGPYAEAPTFASTATVLTIHNLGYQGRFGASSLVGVGLAGYPELLPEERLEEGELNFLEIGLVHADMITTVSPTYAREIQTHEGGAGLSQLLRRRSADLVGVLNGIDTEEWNPRTDPHIPYRYSEKSLWRKERNKAALLGELGLPYRAGVPVLGVISRLVSQKGIEIMRGPLLHFLDTWDLRLVVLGSGETRYEDFFTWLADTYGDKVAFVPGYDYPLSHRIEAGSDIFLMPSLYEPCGLNQMYSLAYGTAPVVRRVGGLADSVTQFDAANGSGTGFVFEHYTEDGLGWALGQALTLHLDRRSWQILQRNGMAEDNSWEDRAGEYAKVYAEALAKARRQD